MGVFGEKVKAYPGIEEARVGFIIGEPNEEGKEPVQVGSEVHALNRNEEAEEGNRGGTYRSLNN